MDKSKKPKSKSRKPKPFKYFGNVFNSLEEFDEHLTQEVIKANKDNPNFDEKDYRKKLKEFCKK